MIQKSLPGIDILKIIVRYTAQIVYMYKILCKLYKNIKKTFTIY